MPAAIGPAGWWPRLIGAGMLFAAAAAPAPVHAQAPPPTVPQGSPISRILPPAPPSVSPGAPLAPPPAPSTEVPNQPVRVTSVSIEGVTAYPMSALSPLTDGLVGPATPLPRIDAARLAILQHYRADGYVLSAVSVNFDVPSGRLRFIVTEGRIASVKLDGNIGPAGTQVLRFLNRLTEQQPIDSATLERYLLLAQDVPGVKLHAVLQPSADDPGALNLIAQVSRQAVSGLATVDNRAFVNTGPIEALGVVDFNSFSEFGEKTEISLYHTFPNSETFGQAATEVFLGASGLKLRVYGGSGASLPTGPLALQDYKGTTTVFGGQLSYPLIRARQQTLNLRLAFDGIQSVVDLGSPSIIEQLRLAACAATGRRLRPVGPAAGRRAVGAQCRLDPTFQGPADPRRLGQRRSERAAPGRTDQLRQVRLPAQPHPDLVQPVAGRVGGADGPAGRPGEPRRAAAVGGVLPGRHAVHPRLLFGPGHRRQRDRRHRRTAAQHLA